MRSSRSRSATSASSALARADLAFHVSHTSGAKSSGVAFPLMMSSSRRPMISAPDPRCEKTSAMVHSAGYAGSSSSASLRGSATECRCSTDEPRASRIVAISPRLAPDESDAYDRPCPRSMPVSSAAARRRRGVGAIARSGARSCRVCVGPRPVPTPREPGPTAGPLRPGGVAGRSRPSGRVPRAAADPLGRRTIRL